MTNLKGKFWKVGRWYGAIFIVLLAFRLLYGYVATSTGRGDDYSDDFFSSIENLRRNYASEKFAPEKIALKKDVAASASIASNQKFEKTASVKSKTSEFGQDEKLVKAKTLAYKAIIQYEQNLGQKGNRQIHLLIVVPPAMFDKFYQEIQQIGSVKATEITKVDKTNEYRQLNAKKVSIEKTLQSLNELKSKGGQIADFVSLNDKILEIEEKLQELGVELGNFDAENEFCTVKFSLYEGATEKSISFIHRLKVALEWTVKYFAILVFASLGLSVTIFILLLIADKLKLLTALTNNMSRE
ncbi:DUF4349 domain-containing protein [Hymenobacter sp. BT559]|uniref:DUF4349 domain-containing protein n=1 Tax=Hymenobacter sp. BT559 TaxID=2795729 RepID=UPI0018EB2BA5|nr:DUF4349 domain-containing protein [Hymenobacter sp. BT559]MBJ6145926.1 DUF4349 domain-containing protein [Hymenobacter sp. BT559]